MSDRRQQSGAGPLTGLLAMLVVAVLVVLVGLGAIYLLASGSGSGGDQTAVPASTTGDQPEQIGTPQDSGTLPGYVLSASEDTKMAYQFALDRPDVLMWMPCYCGCGDHSGHKSAKNCFIKESSTPGNPQFDEHGASCAMCVGIALDAKTMTEEGRSLGEIRAYIDQEYGSIGPGTDTPFPPA